MAHKTDIPRCIEAERHCELAPFCDGDIRQSRQRLLEGGEPAMPLCMACAGETVHITRIHGEQRVRKRLADLGLTIGTPIRVVQGGRNAMILAVKNDTRLGIGRDMARCIWVVSGEAS